MATSIPGVFAAGDIAAYPAKFKLIATGAAEAVTAVNHAVTPHTTRRRASTPATRPTSWPPESDRPASATQRAIAQYDYRRAIVNQVEGIAIVWATVRPRFARESIVDSFHGADTRRSSDGRYYFPFRYVPGMLAELRERSARRGHRASQTATGKFPSRHPAALMEAAVKASAAGSRGIEQQLAEAWCAPRSR